MSFLWAAVIFFSLVVIGGTVIVLVGYFFDRTIERRGSESLDRDHSFEDWFDDI